MHLPLLLLLLSGEDVSLLATTISLYPGIEFTLTDDLFHYTYPDDLFHFVLPEE
jgi:hypothetical protein